MEAVQIEHDPKEPKIDRGNWPFYFAWAIVVAAWLSLFLTGYQFDWTSVAAGAGTIGVLIITVSEKYGNKSPW